MTDKSEAEIEADEVIDTFDELVRQRDALLIQNERLLNDIEQWNATIAAGAAKAEQMEAVIQAARAYATHRHVVCMPCMENLKAALAAYDANQTPLPVAFRPGA
jgi:hypothetical protein